MAKHKISVVFLKQSVQVIEADTFKKNFQK